MALMSFFLVWPSNAEEAEKLIFYAYQYHSDEDLLLCLWANQLWFQYRHREIKKKEKKILKNRTLLSKIEKMV